jgi:hypothetical protein
MVRRIVLGLTLCGAMLASGCAHGCGSWCGWWKRRCCNPCPPACPPAAGCNNNYVNPAFVPAAPPPGAVTAPPPGAVVAPPNVSQFGPTPDAVVPQKPFYTNGTYR